MAVIILTSGTSWTRPINCPNTLDKVECYGCGGNGKGLTYIDDLGGHGGGGGAYARKTNYNIGLRTTFNIQIPQGNGSQSLTYFDNVNTGITADYGQGAIYGRRGGLASACVGDVKYGGGNGGMGQTEAWGGGGGCASNAGSGFSGGSGYGTTNGNGGDAGPGGALGGHASSTSGQFRGSSGGSDPDGGGGGGAPVGHGGNPGGGGAGGYYGGGSGDGRGARGQITITYTPLTNIVISIIESRCNL